MAKELQRKPKTHRKYVLTQAEDLTCQNKVDKQTRIDLVETPREFEKESEEAEVIMEQKRIQEEEVWKILQQHLESWESAKRHIEAMAGKAWQLTQSSGTKGKNLEQDSENFLNMAKEKWLGQRQREHCPNLDGKGREVVIQKIEKNKVLEVAVSSPVWGVFQQRRHVDFYVLVISNMVLDKRAGIVWACGARVEAAGGSHRSHAVPGSNDVYVRGGGGGMQRAALSCQFVLDLLTVGNVPVAGVRRNNKKEGSPGEDYGQNTETATV